MHNVALQDTVQRAAAFNRSLTRRAEAARVISPAAAVQEPLSSAPAEGAFSAEQPALQADADSAAQPDQVDAAAAFQEQLPASLPTVPEEGPAASPEAKAEGHGGGGAKESESAGGESRPAADAEAPGLANEVPSNLEAVEAIHEPVSERLISEAPEYAQEPDHTASSTSEVEPQEQAGIEDPEHRTPSTSEQHDIKTSRAEAPEQASMPKAAGGLIQDAPQAEQLLPALMRQVMPCYLCTIEAPSLKKPPWRDHKWTHILSNGV